MKALILAGSCPQIILINKLKKRGIYTILADNNPSAVARPFADEFVKINILDSEAVKKVAKDKKVDFIIVVCADQVILIGSKVSEELGLPYYIDYKTIEIISNKGLMKDIFSKNGIPSSKHAFMFEIQMDKISKMNFPLVVKPVDSYSSKGVRKCSNFEELKTYFYEAKKISRSGEVIVEEYVEGSELTVDFQIIDGKAYLLSYSNTEKVNYKDRFLAFRTRFPAQISESTVERIKKIGQKIADSFGLKNTPMLIQLLTDDKKEFVLEFSARTGGGAKYLLIKEAMNFDPIDAVINLTLKENVDINEVKVKNKFVTNEFLYTYPGIFDHLEGFEELKGKGIINEYWLFKSKGTEIISATTSSDRVASITITANTNEEMVNKHNLISKKIKIIDKDGKDIMRHDFLTEIKPIKF